MHRFQETECTWSPQATPPPIHVLQEALSSTPYPLPPDPQASVSPLNAQTGRCPRWSFALYLYILPSYNPPKAPTHTPLPGLTALGGRSWPCLQ